jgi:hypothetical protein
MPFVFILLNSHVVSYIENNYIAKKQKNGR